MSNELIKIVAVVIIAAVLIIILKNQRSEYAFLTLIVSVTLVMIFVISNLWSSFSSLRDLFAKSGNSGAYFTTALKALGIAYIAGFAADVCRDFGLSSLAQTAEIAGKVTIFVLSIPLATAVMEAALKFVGI